MMDNDDRSLILLNISSSFVSLIYKVQYSFKKKTFNFVTK